MKFHLARAAHLRLGRRGERDARRLLEEKGYVFLASGWRCPSGELDLVMRDGGTMVFVEVKTLRRRGFYGPMANLSIRQMRRNLRAGQAYLRDYAPEGMECRYDLVEVIRGRWSCREIRHHEGFIGTELLGRRNGV